MLGWSDPSARIVSEPGSMSSSIGQKWAGIQAARQYANARLMPSGSWKFERLC